MQTSYGSTPANAAPIPRVSMAVKFWRADQLKENGPVSDPIFIYYVTGLFPVKFATYTPTHKTADSSTLQRSVTFAFNDFVVLTKDTAEQFNLKEFFNQNTGQTAVAVLTGPSEEQEAILLNERLKKEEEAKRAESERLEKKKAKEEASQKAKEEQEKRRAEMEKRDADRNKPKNLLDKVTSFMKDVNKGINKVNRTLNEAKSIARSANRATRNVLTIKSNITKAVDNVKALSDRFSGSPSKSKSSRRSNMTLNQAKRVNKDANNLGDIVENKNEKNDAIEAYNK